MGLPFVCNSIPIELKDDEHLAAVFKKLEGKPLSEAKIRHEYALRKLKADAKKLGFEVTNEKKKRNTTHLSLRKKKK